MIILTFDTEEFDLPLEYGPNISFEEQISHSKEGLRIILDILRCQIVKATFFCTCVFAGQSKELIKEIILDGHEVASHGKSHSSFTIEDIKKSKVLLEEITERKVIGYQMPYMKITDNQNIADAGYSYGSSLNPTFIPGRYNNLHFRRTLHYDKGIIELPASVTPKLRIPLFWLSIHNFPFYFYLFLCRKTLKRDGYQNLYFHSWELSSHLNEKYLKLPYIIRRNSCDKLKNRLERLIMYFIAKGESFVTIGDFINKSSSKISN